MTGDELRKIQVMTVDFPDIVVRSPARDFFDPVGFASDQDFISDYEEIVASLLHRGLATSAVRISDLSMIQFTVEGFLFQDTKRIQGCLIYAIASSADEETMNVLPDKRAWEGKHGSIGYITRLAGKGKSGVVQREAKVKLDPAPEWW
jgi:hypothetical protein